MASEDPAVQNTLARINARAWGISLGLLFGLGVFAATVILLLKGGEDPGGHLGRLNQIFPGYDVTFTGSLIGFVYAFVVGYALGLVIAPRRGIARAERAGRALQHARLKGRAWGLSTGLLLALALFATTNVLVLRGGAGERVGPLLRRLAIYFPGFEVTYAGSLIGFAWLFAVGYLLGRLIAVVYNRTVLQAER